MEKQGEKGEEKRKEKTVKEKEYKA